jgi:hypothetical protein
MLILKFYKKFKSIKVILLFLLFELTPKGRDDIKLKV